MNYKTQNNMFTAKFIKNIIFDGVKIRAIGRSGSPTRVLAVQGDLDGSWESRGQVFDSSCNSIKGTGLIE